MAFKDPDQKKRYDREYQRQRRNQGAGIKTAKPFGYVTKEGRVVRGDVLDQYAYKGAGGESTQIKVDRFAGTYQGEGLIQPLYNPETLAGIVEINAYHSRCCNVKARDTAGLGWDLVALTDKPDEKIREEIEDFFNSGGMPLTSKLYRHQHDIEVIGHGGLEIVREANTAEGTPAVLAHVPGHTLRIHQSENKYAQKRGTKTRWFKKIGYQMDVDKDTGKESPLNSLQPGQRAAELIWNALYSQRSDFYGVPDIIPALGAVHGDMARRDYNIAFFDNYGVPAYAVFITGDYDPGDVDQETGKTELETTIEGHFKEMAKNPHATLVLAVPTIEGANGGEVKIEFKPLAVEVRDASFRLYRRDNRDEVISAHGVPPYRLGIAEEGSLGGSTAAESTSIYKSSIINPRQEILEAMINQHLIWAETGFHTNDFEFKFREVDTSDEKHDIEIITRLFSMGALRIRDVIRIFGQRFGLEDDPNDPLLDARYVNGQVMVDPADQAEGLKAIKSVQELLIREMIRDEAGNESSTGPQNRAEGKVIPFAPSSPENAGGN